MTNDRNDIQDIQRSRKIATKAKVLAALEIIQNEINENGLYPHNAGKLTLMEVARRAGVGGTTLRNRHHLETRNHVKACLAKIAGCAPITKGAMKAAGVMKVAFYEDALRKANTAALLWREELQALRRENQQLRDQLTKIANPRLNVISMGKIEND